MVLVAAVVVEDDRSAFVRCKVSNKHLCCRDEDRAPGAPSRRWPDGAAAPAAVGSAVSTLSCEFAVSVLCYIYGNFRDSLESKLIL